MSQTHPRELTARQFAAEMRINYRTALNWLDAGLVPGAERKNSPVGEFWAIPVSALKMERPRPGPKPGAKKAGKRSAAADGRRVSPSKR